MAHPGSSSWLWTPEMPRLVVGLVTLPATGGQLPYKLGPGTQLVPGSDDMEATCDIGLIGLAVMGQNLVLNMNDHGYKVGGIQSNSVEG